MKYDRMSEEELVKVEALYTLPTLAGSPKQIAWARDIRAKSLNKTINHLENRFLSDFQTPKEIEAGKLQLLERARARTSSRFWIDHRFDEVYGEWVGLVLGDLGCRLRKARRARQRHQHEEKRTRECIAIERAREPEPNCEGKVIVRLYHQDMIAHKWEMREEAEISKDEIDDVVKNIELPRSSYACVYISGVPSIVVTTTGVHRIDAKDAK